SWCHGSNNNPCHFVYFCIEDGENLRTAEAPYQAAIFSPDNGPNQKPNCSGALISSYTVITSAACVRNLPIRVTLGATNISKEEPTQLSYILNGDRILIPEDRQEIAIIKLTERIRFNKFVSPIPISDLKENLTHQLAHVTSWGSEGGILREASPRITPNYECVSYRDGLFENDKICTDLVACTGDYGAPLIWMDPKTRKKLLIGLVSSFNPSCIGKATEYIKLDLFLDWIKKSMEETEKELRRRNLRRSPAVMQNSIGEYEETSKESNPVKNRGKIRRVSRSPDEGETKNTVQHSEADDKQSPPEEHEKEDGAMRKGIFKYILTKIPGKVTKFAYDVINNRSRERYPKTHRSDRLEKGGGRIMEIISSLLRLINERSDDHAAYGDSFKKSNIERLISVLMNIIHGSSRSQTDRHEENMILLTLDYIDEPFDTNIDISRHRPKNESKTKRVIAEEILPFLQFIERKQYFSGDEDSSPALYETRNKSKITKLLSLLLQLTNRLNEDNGKNGPVIKELSRLVVELFHESSGGTSEKNQMKPGSIKRLLLLLLQLIRKPNGDGSNSENSPDRDDARNLAPLITQIITEVTGRSQTNQPNIDELLSLLLQLINQPPREFPEYDGNTPSKGYGPENIVDPTKDMNHSEEDGFDRILFMLSKFLEHPSPPDENIPEPGSPDESLSMLLKLSEQVPENTPGIARRKLPRIRDIFKKFSSLLLQIFRQPSGDGANDRPELGGIGKFIQLLLHFFKKSRQSTPVYNPNDKGEYPKNLHNQDTGLIISSFELLNELSEQTEPYEMA
ncbi:hypothetical protein JTB14_037220, partial [Gonioctena quinquepunctata]